LVRSIDPGDYILGDQDGIVSFPEPKPRPL